MDVARLNLSHGTHADHERSYRWCARPPTPPGTASAIFADLQGPKIRLEHVRRRPGRAAPRARSSRSPPATSPGDDDDLRHDVRRAARRRRGRRPDPDRRRQGPAAGDRGRRHRRAHRGRGRRQGQRPQGHQPARRGGQRAGAVGEGRARTCAGRCDLAVDFIALSFVRAGRGRRRRARDHARGGRPAARHRQDREAAGDRQPRRGRSRPSTASWSPAATSAWSARWRTCRSCRSGSSRRPGATPSR